MTELEKLFAGINRISDYNIDIDFDNDEISQLLDADIIKASDIGICRASDLLIDGVIDYEQYPFEKFSAYEQIRQLQYCVIEPTEFLEKADLDTFDSDEWLYLLEVLPRITEKAPWDELRKNGSVKSWMDLLKSRPEFAKYASWKTLAEKGRVENFFDLARAVPELYEHFTNKEQMLQSDSALWVKLLARRPELAEVYPLENLDEVDEVEFLLLHQPQLVDRISWDKENPPVKLYIINPAPEILTEINPAMAWFITAGISEKLQNILKNVLFYNSDDARCQANIIGHNAETFAGIYSRQTAEHIVQEFMKEAAENQLDLQIRKEEIAYGN